MDVDGMEKSALPTGYDPHRRHVISWLLLAGASPVSITWIPLEDAQNCGGKVRKSTRTCAQSYMYRAVPSKYAQICHQNDSKQNFVQKCAGYIIKILAQV